MNIRNATFWKQLEPIFSRNEITFHSEAGVDTNYCDYGAIRERIQHALCRAHRNKTLVLLLRLQLTHEKTEESEITAARVNNLLRNRIGGCLRLCDSICQMSNNHLAILMEDINEPCVIPLIIEKIYTTLINPRRDISKTEGMHLYVGASLFPTDALDERQLWRQAEEALGHAIRSEQDAFRFYSGVTGHEIMERFELTKALYKAYKDNEFRIVYQPIFRMDSRRIKAVEALMRWHHPESGLLYPLTFLDKLEESGLTVPVGEKVIKECCLFVRSLLDQGYAPVRMCINVSARQLQDSGLSVAILDALYETDLDPNLLQFEFSEEDLANNFETARVVLSEINNIGVIIAVDRFGGGKLSLADLMRLPVKQIKIDPSLLESITYDAASQATLSSILLLAKNFEMDVAVVGVEHGSQFDMLHSMGCLEVQSDYMSKPVNANELRNILSSLGYL